MSYPHLEKRSDGKLWLTGTQTKVLEVGGQTFAQDSKVLARVMRRVLAEPGLAMIEVAQQGVHPAAVPVLDLEAAVARLPVEIAIAIARRQHQQAPLGRAEFGEHELGGFRGRDDVLDL